jgi:hypothetical protein
MSFNQRGIGMMVFSLAVLVIIGVMYNNFTSSGAFTNPNPSGNCNGASPSINCAQFPTVLPCNIPANCKLQTPNFLNQQSPFTYLIQGNLIGFVSSFSAVNFTSTNGYLQFSLCKANQGSGNHITSFACYGSISGWGCFMFGNGFGQGGPLNLSSTTGNNSIYTITGYMWQTYPSINCNFEGVPLVRGYASAFANYTVFNATYYTVKSYNSANFVVGGNPGAQSNLAMFIGFAIGIILLILSLGIGFTIPVPTSQASIVSNPQGTRMVQVIGFGLVSWIPLFSEFSAWINPNVLGLGLDVVVLFGLTGLFFVGAWDQFSTGGGGS